MPSARQCTLVPVTQKFRASRATNPMAGIVRKLWFKDDGQDIAEYAVMLAVVLIIVIGTIRLIGGNSSNVFSSVGSSIGGL